MIKDLTQPSSQKSKKKQKAEHKSIDYKRVKHIPSDWSFLKRLTNKMHHKISRIFNDDEHLTNNVKLQHNYHAIRDLIPTILYNEQEGCFINGSSIGFMLEGNCLVSGTKDCVKTITNLLSSDIPEGTIIEVSNIASAKTQKLFNFYQESRRNADEIYQTLASKRAEHFKDANYNSLFPFPYLIRDFRLIISVSIPIDRERNGGMVDNFNKIKTFFQGNKNANNTSKQDLIKEEITKGKQFEQLRKLKKSFISSLNSVGIFTSEAKPNRLLNYLHEIINPDRSKKGTEQETNNKTQQEATKELKVLGSDNKKYKRYSSIANQVSKDNLLAVNKDFISFFADNKDKRIDVRSFNTKTYPDYFALWQGQDLIGDFYNDLAQIPCPFITSFTIRIPKNIQGKHSKMQAKAIRAMQQAETSLAKYIPELKEKSQDFSFTTKHIREGQKLVETYCQVTLFSPPEKLEEASQILTSLYKKNSFQLVKDKYMQLQSYMSLVPFNFNEGLFDDLEKGGRTDTMLTWSCANLMPLLGESYGHFNSPAMMLFGRRGQPLFYNPFANTGGNYNVAVVGKSGSGKSVFMQELVTSLLGFGGKVYVVDDGRSFMNSCKLQGGTFIEFVNNSNICINPFSLLSDNHDKSKLVEGGQEKERKAREKQDASRRFKGAIPEREQEQAEEIDNNAEVLILINTMIKQMARSQSSTCDIENSYISEAVDEAFKLKGNSATITTVRDILKKKDDMRAKDIALMLRPFTRDGEYKNYFEGECNISIESCYMVFELSEIKNKKDLQSIIMQFIMFLVFQQMYMGDRQKSISIVIDEAWDLLHGEETGKFIEGLARRARKYNGNIITGTQSINDYYKTSATKAIIENSDWTCLLSQKPESIEAFKNSGRILMDEEMEKTLKSLKTLDKKYSEVMICANGSYMIGRLIVDPYAIALYSSKAEDFNAIEEMTKQGLTVAQALDRIVSQNT